MRKRLRRDLTAALKARDRVAVAALRSAVAAIDNAEAVDADSVDRPPSSSAHVAGASAGAGSSDVERRVLSERELQAILRGVVKERSEAADQYEKLGRKDAATRLRDEAAILSKYL